MRPKSLLLLALALGCGLVASIGISQVMEGNAKNARPDIETAPIYVALHNINLGDPIDASMVSLQEWPKDKIPPGALTQLEEIEGRRPRAAIIQGEPILDAKLLAPGEHADPIGAITEGYRLVTISVNAEKSAAGLLSPGDRVDVQLFATRNDSAGIKSPTTKVILQNIRVFAIEQAVQRSGDGGEARSIPKTVSLLVTPEQASKIDLAQNLGELSLIPRNPNDEAETTTVEVTAQDLWGDGSDKNTRKAEQNRNAAKENQRDTEGFFSGLVTMMKKNAEQRPPFEMEVLRADEVEVMVFDAATGKPLRDYNEKRKTTGPAEPAGSEPSAGSIGDAAPTAPFPIDLQIDR